jgi:hypothetical protein
MIGTLAWWTRRGPAPDLGAIVAVSPTAGLLPPLVVRITPCQSDCQAKR